MSCWRRWLRGENTCCILYIIHSHIFTLYNSTNFQFSFCLSWETDKLYTMLLLFMSTKVTWEGKRVLTYFTGVRFLTSVGSVMSFEITGTYRTKIADSTLMWALSSVGSNVVFKFLDCLESLFSSFSYTRLGEQPAPWRLRVQDRLPIPPPSPAPHNGALTQSLVWRGKTWPWYGRVEVIR